MWSIDFTDKFDLSYLPRTLMEYMGSPAFMIGYVLLLLLFLFWKDKQMREIFTYPFLLQCLTVFNILILDFVVPLLGLTSRYYRFFWILPVAVCEGLICAIWISKVRKKAAKILLGVVLILGILCAGWQGRIYNHGEEGNVWPFTLERENTYKVPDHILELSDLLHAEGLESPMIICPYEEQIFLRQYDADIRIAFARYYLAEQPVFGEEEIHEMLASDRYTAKLWMFIKQDVQMEAAVLEEALLKNNVDYMVLDEVKAAYVSELGYERLGTVEDLHVFKVK